MSLSGPCGRLGGALLILPALVVAQPPVPPPGEPDSPAATVDDEVEVNVVNIDVHVTNRRGQPIPDLAAADFEVYENGERMEITNFLSATAGQEEFWVDGVALEAPADTEAPLTVALFIDRYRTHRANLRRVESDVAAFLANRASNTRPVRFLLATSDPELTIRVPFTQDQAELRTALEKLREDLGKTGTGDELLRRQTFREIRGSYEDCALGGATGNEFAPDCEPCQDMWSGFLNAANRYAAETQSRSAASVSALGELLTALGGLPGPKAVILFSDGLPLRPGADLYHYIGEVCPERQTETDRMQNDWDETTRFNRLSAFSNANRVTLYPIDTGGIRASSAVDASIAGPVGALDGDDDVSGGGAGAQRLANVLVPSAQNDRLRVDNLQASLSLLADETGGRAVFNENRPARAMDELAADFGSYYSLGYAAPSDSRYSIRQIEVRLTKPRKGWRVRYRRTYILKSEEQRLADRLYAALKLGEQSNPLGADVTFGEVQEGAGRNQATLPVEVHVPLAAVTQLPGPSGSSGTVRIFLVAGNDTGERTSMRQKAVTLSAAQLAAQVENTLVVVNVDLPPGRFDVAVGIRDEATGRTSYLVKDVQLP